MATYYAELTGGEIVASVGFEGGAIYAEETLSGGEIYPSGGGGGGANLETLTLSYTPSETAISETLLPDPGYDGFDEVDVSVGAIPSNYVGSAIPLKSSSDLTVSGATVTAPSGYYSANATKTIPNASPLILSGLAVQNDGTVEVDLDIVSGGYIPSQSDTLEAGTLSVKGAQTYTPGTTDQTIASGKFLTGAQTILGDANLLPENIKKDVTIFGKVGTYEGGGGGVTVTALSAVYTQSGDVDITDELDELKKDLVVTATINNTENIELGDDEYTLSGTLSVGVCTITASYGGLTANFSVTATSNWTHVWRAKDGIIPSWLTPVTIGSGSVVLTSDGIELHVPNTSDYARVEILDIVDGSNKYFAMYVEISTSAISSSNSVRVCASNGTNGTQISASPSYGGSGSAWRLLNSDQGQTRTYLIPASTGKDYSVLVYYAAPSNTGSININGVPIRSWIPASPILYATRNAVWAQGTNGTVLIKTIKVKGSVS